MTSELTGAVSAATDMQKFGSPEELPSGARREIPSRWRSLGGRFDYRFWSERERFLQLDSAIMAELKMDREHEELWGAARCADDDSSYAFDEVLAAEDGPEGLPSFLKAA